ncbi:hypothetical protein Tco_0506040 [Tanacetum coccineum]
MILGGRERERERGERQRGERREEGKRESEGGNRARDDTKRGKKARQRGRRGRGKRDRGKREKREGTDVGQKEGEEAKEREDKVAGKVTEDEKVDVDIANAINEEGRKNFNNENIMMIVR